MHCVTSRHVTSRHALQASGYDDYSESVLTLDVWKSDHGVAYICWSTNNVTTSDKSDSYAFSVVCKLA